MMHHIRKNMYHFLTTNVLVSFINYWQGKLFRRF